MPESLNVTDPPVFVMLIPLAHADIGISSAQQASSTATSLMIPSTEFERPFPTAPGPRVAGISNEQCSMVEGCVFEKGDCKTRDSRREPLEESREVDRPQRSLSGRKNLCDWSPCEVTIQVQPFAEKRDFVCAFGDC